MNNSLPPAAAPITPLPRIYWITPDFTGTVSDYLERIEQHHLFLAHPVAH